MLTHRSLVFGAEMARTIGKVPMRLEVIATSANQTNLLGPSQSGSCRQALLVAIRGQSQQVILMTVRHTFDGVQVLPLLIAMVMRGVFRDSTIMANSISRLFPGRTTPDLSVWFGRREVIKTLWGGLEMQFRDGVAHLIRRQ